MVLRSIIELLRISNPKSIRMIRRNYIFAQKCKIVTMEIGMLILGICAGIMSGLFGVGGGIVMVPLLVGFFGMDLLNANATSLAAMLLPVGIFGVINYYKAGLIQVKNAIWISFGILCGSFFGAELAVTIDIKTLSKLYALLLLYVAADYLEIPKRLGLTKKKTVDTPFTKSPSYKFWQFILLGVVAGIYAGLFGKGGGLVIVPMLIGFFKYDAKAATATSLAALQLPVGLPSVIVYAESGYLNIGWAALLAVGILAGVFIGSKVAIKLSVDIFRKIYALFLLVIAIYMVVKYL